MKSEYRLTAWESPPKVRRENKREELDTIVEELKKRPGEWARVGVGKAPSAAGNFKRRGCDATTRKQKDGTYIVYARWVEEP